MQISIVTVYGSKNHGSYLQAKYLREALLPYGNVVFLDNKSRQWALLRAIKRDVVKCLRSSGYKGVFRILKFVVCENIKFKCLWKALPSNGDVCADVFVLGSDEIWNVTREECKFKEFYNIGLHGRAISYAPSINNSSFDDYKEEATLVLGINSVDFVSVRDSRSKEILESFIDKKINIVIDPTLLYDAPVETVSIQKPYLAVYGFDHQIDEALKKEIITFARKRDLLIVSAGRYIPWCDLSMNSKRGNPFYIYKNAKYVITTTFHGTAFAINYKANFVSVSKNNEKIYELLKTFGLQDRLTCNPENIEDILANHYDVSTVDQKLNELRNESFSFLRESIQNI